MKFKIKNLTFIILLFSILFICIRPIETSASNTKVEVQNGKVVLNSSFGNENEAFHHVIERYKTIITFFSAIGAITMVGIFIYTFIKLGATAGNPMERQKCITGLIITGIATALLGSTALFVGLFYSAFKD